jgi:hypothetical protein
MNERIRELAAEILRLRGEPASDDEHFAFAFVRHLFLSQMQRAEKAEAALAEAVEALKHYGQHVDKCVDNESIDCICGYTTAMKECERVSIPYENTSSEAAAAIRKGE